ncbi:MAG TPA: methyltransferase domain-containing protein [candidate division Zixibacteria bacterium]|jgi:D-alanine-D-alanine ligase
MKKDPAPRRRTLGPVSDLERHLPTDWWRHLFNSVYLKTDGDVIENRDNTRREVEIVIRVADLDRDSRILDLCCGQGRHSIELARRGFHHVTGVDRSRYLIRLARKRARSERLDVRFHEGDARKYRTQGEPYHCVALLGNSFGYFDMESDDAAVLESVRRAAVSNGSLVLDLADGDWVRAHYQPRSWEWIDENHLVCRERSISRDGDRLIAREVVVHAERGMIADQFYAERLYSEERITALLRANGFGDIRNHGPVAAESTRGQDLGMMEHRLILTARTPRRVAIPRPEVGERRSVTVIMGDPRLPDEVKLEEKFNAEDMDTIDRLKRALAELDEYEFTYLDDHETLISDLRHEPPEFVLNLCDEGFGNDPLCELHVPAILELLGIPYTGAGPGCLGLCYDKGLVRTIAASEDIPVPLESYCGPDDTSATLPSTFPALVKPNLGDSSMGITQHAVVNDSGELFEYFTWLREKYGRKAVLVQEYLTGPEYTVAIIGNPGRSIRTLPVLEVDYSGLNPGLPRILSYESKWDPHSPYWTQIKFKEADADAETERRLIDYSNILFERLSCRDYARFDFRCDDEGTPKLLEVNPNPGWCWDGKLNIMAEMGGLRYAELLRLIIEAAHERNGLRPARVHEAEPAPSYG